MATRTTTSEPARQVPNWVRGIAVLLLLYLFLTGIALLEGGIGALGGDVQETLFDSATNAFAALFVGILATVLVQSSSVTTSTIVGLVAAGVIGVDSAVFMVMGANIGTTVTNTLASLGHVRQPAEFRRAFSAATVHDMFNVLAVLVLFPLELATGFLARSSTWLADNLVGTSGADFKSPIKEAVKWPSGIVEDLLAGLGLDGNWLGIAMIVVGLGSIFVALAFITRNMRALVAERVERSLNELLSRNAGLVAMGFGLVATVAVQSSSITTSTLIPLAAAGVITLENIYPVTLGANLGTTVTALLAALATGSTAALSVAFAHTLFNLTGIVIFFPIPQLRALPIRGARWIADLAVRNRALALSYVGVSFIIVPLVGLLVLR